MNPPGMPHEAEVVTVGAWTAHRSSGELVGVSGTQILEPKVMELLFLLAARRGEVVTREEIVAKLWPRVVVNEDSLARCVFKLRKALGDEARSPRYIETLSKRGYRLTPEPLPPAADPVSAEPGKSKAPAGTLRRPRIWMAAALAGTTAVTVILWLALPKQGVSDSELLLKRADDFYHQMTQAQNEAAVELYQRLIASNEQQAGAYAGLANAFAQRAIRWPKGVATQTAYTKLGDAIRGGEMRAGYASAQLEEARRFAQIAVTLAPLDARAHKALGLVLSAREDFSGALASYERAIELDPEAWQPLIDTADVLEISGQPREALPFLERAYAVMTRQRETHTTQIMPWYAATAVLIGDRYEKFDDAVSAMKWYRQALDYAPLDIDATRRLARLLERSGDGETARLLCEQLSQRLGRNDGCLSQ